MANRNIAFTIQLNGTEQVFNSIAELENAISQATQELKVFTGSEADFKKLQDEIKKANTELTKIKEGTRGLTAQKQIGEFLKFGQVVAGAFGAATTALSLFGKENEDVTAAAAKAQQILTLQYSLATLAKEKDTIFSALNTASKIANTVATQGLTAATRLLFAAIRANPMGAFLTILGAVVSALVLFTDETDDATAAEERFQNTLAKGQVARQREIQLLQAQGATELELAEKAAKQAEDRFRMAQFYFFNTSRDSELFAKVQEEYDTAQFERDLAQQNLENARENTRKKNAEAQEDRLEREKERQEELNRVRQKEIEISIEAYRIRNQLSLIGKDIGEDESALLNTLEERLSNLQALVLSEERYLTVQEKLNKALSENAQEQDTYGVVFERFRVEAEKGFDQFKDGKISIDELTKSLRKFSLDFAVNAQGALDPTLLDDFFFYTEEYINFFKQGTKLMGDSAQSAVKVTLDAFEQAAIDLALLRGQITFDPFSEGGYMGDPLRMRTQEELLNDLTTAEERYNQVIKSLEGQYAKALRSQEQFRDASDEQLKPLIEEQIELFVKLTGQILKYENDVSNTALSIQKLNEELAKTAPAAREGLILSNLDSLLKEFDVKVGGGREKLLALEEEISTKRFDFERQYAEDVIALQLQLSEQIPGFAQLSYEAKLEILKAFLEKEITAQEEAEQKKQEAQQKTIDKILEQIQLFQAGLQAIQQAVSDYYNFQFDQLEKRNKRIQDTIVGDSERANELRLEADKAYTAERERLEKQQAKISLRLTLAQTIANVAQAVAQSLASPLLAGVIAAAGAVQIGLVTQQINSLNAYNRGGRLRKGQGGLVVGPPHEQGGVKFQGGGVELEGNEVVINRLSSLRYADILSSINVAGGGKPIVMSNFDDSRIVEAIAKQRQMPLRAYVVESDITNAQTINKRLELLSQI